MWKKKWLHARSIEQTFVDREDEERRTWTSWLTIVNDDQDRLTAIPPAFGTGYRKPKTNNFRDMFNLPYHLPRPSMTQKTPWNCNFNSDTTYMEPYPTQLSTGKIVIKNQTAGESSTCLAIVFLLTYPLLWSVDVPSCITRLKKEPKHTEQPARVIMKGKSLT